MTRLEFKIDLLSDYHVGAGHGGETSDSALLRDGDGQAAIRGSILAGLLRDALWRLLRQAPPGTLLARQAGKCRASGAGSDAEPYCRTGAPCPVCRIFGSPAQPKGWRVGTARPRHSKTPQVPEHDAQRIGGLEVQRARVNPRTRRTEPHKLFSQERGSSRWDLRFEVDRLAADDDAEAEAALILASARLIRGLGRSRRRGLGECRLHLADPDRERELLATFERIYLTAAGAEPSPQPSAAIKERRLKAPELGARSSQWVCRRLWVRLDEPLLLALRPEGGNEFEGSAEIPGTSLLGALASRAARLLHLSPQDAPPAGFSQVFLRGRIQFPTLRALAPAVVRSDEATGPVVRDSDVSFTPTIRAPLGLLTCPLFPSFGVSEGHGPYPFGSDAAADGRCPDCLKSGKESALKSVDGLLGISVEPQQWRPVRRQEMHIAIDPETGRVGEGNLFGYTSLESGQLFVGDLVCDADAWEALTEFCRLPGPGTPFSVRLGKATRRGHGMTTVVWQPIEAADPTSEPFRGLPLSQRIAFGSTRLRMTFLTDAIIPDAWGRYFRGFEEDWVSRALNRSAPPRIIASSARTRLVDGFMGNLGLPRFRDLAICAGSDALLDIDGANEEFIEALAKLEREGIGLRRGEGFGQVAFNHPVYNPGILPAANSIEVPGELIAEKTGKSDLEAIEEFAAEWEKELDRLDSDPGNGTKGGTGLFENADYLPVARLLRQHAGSVLPVLVERLEDGRYGSAGILLGRPLGGPRNDKAAVRHTAEGRRQIRRLIGKLLTEPDAEGDGSSASERIRQTPHLAGQLRRIALESLAERVAQGAVRARQKSRGGRLAAARELKS